MYNKDELQENKKTKGNEIMKANSRQEAFEMVMEIFPGEFEEDRPATEKAGYKVYRGENYYDYVCDLGDRFEVNLADGRTINVWIKEEKKMTIKEWRENTPLKEQREFATKLQCWLGQYTDQVYKSVMLRIEEILNNPAALNLINELYERTQKEIKAEIDTILYASGYEEDILKFGLHNHPLEHSKSYRDILYDMYIK